MRNLLKGYRNVILLFIEEINLSLEEFIFIHKLGKEKDYEKIFK